MATNVKRKKKAEVMPDDGNMTLTGHLKELRNRLIEPQRRECQPDP